MGTEPRFGDAEKCCGTCVHYSRHYAVNAQGRFVPVRCGTCLRSPNKEQKPDDVCLDWSLAAQCSVDEAEIKRYPLNWKWE